MTINRRDFTTGSIAALGLMSTNPTLAADAAVNRKIVLASRPVGKPSAENFRLEQVSIPSVGDGQVLLKTRYLSLDPYMRGRMNPGKSYAEGVAVGEVMVGGTVSQVISSNNPSFAEGDLVTAYAGWQDYGLSNGEDLMKLPPAIT